MRSNIELNGALQITTQQGFPEHILEVEKHQKNAIEIEEFKNKVFEFKNKTKARIYQIPPSRNFLIQNINNKWIY